MEHKTHQKFQDIIIRIWPFFIIYFLYIFLVLSCTQFYGRDNFHILTNTYNTAYFDLFFKYFTEFGSVYLFFLLAIFYLFKSNWENFLILTISEILASLISLSLKTLVYDKTLRPAFYFFKKNIKLHLVDGVYINEASTYPSGHSLTAVIITMSLCVATKNRKLQLLFALLFPMVAFSRIYLSKHFAIDTVGGGLLGGFIFILVYYILNLRYSKFMGVKIYKNAK